MGETLSFGREDMTEGGYQVVHSPMETQFDVALFDTKALFTPFNDSTTKLNRQGGLAALADALKTDLQDGLPDSEQGSKYSSRKKEYVSMSLLARKVTNGLLQVWRERPSRP